MLGAKQQVNLQQSTLADREKNRRIVMLYLYTYTFSLLYYYFSDKGI